MVPGIDFENQYMIDSCAGPTGHVDSAKEDGEEEKKWSSEQSDCNPLRFVVSWRSTPPSEQNGEETDDTRSYEQSERESGERFLLLRQWWNLKKYAIFTLNR